MTQESHFKVVGHKMHERETQKWDSKHGLFRHLALALKCKAKEGRITQAFNKSRSKYSAVRSILDLRLRKRRNVGHAHTGASDSHFIYYGGKVCFGDMLSVKRATNVPHIIVMIAPLHVKSVGLVAFFCFALKSTFTEHEEAVFAVPLLRLMSIPSYKNSGCPNDNKIEQRASANARGDKWT